MKKRKNKERQYLEHCIMVSRENVNRYLQENKELEIENTLIELN